MGCRYGIVADCNIDVLQSDGPRVVVGSPALNQGFQESEGCLARAPLWRIDSEPQFLVRYRKSMVSMRAGQLRWENVNAGSVLLLRSVGFVLRLDWQAGQL